MALLRQAEDFFKEHLLGHYRWADVSISPREEHDEVAPGTSRYDRPDGKWKERAVIAFGPWLLTLESSTQHPPLGLMRLTGPHGTIEGPNESPTWLAAAGIIKLHKNSKELSYGRT